MSLLILGGTNDALRLTQSLYEKGVPVIYSLAGLVRKPSVDYPVISGGFSQYGGLQRYITDNHIVGIIDVTHPYANTISGIASDAAMQNNIPYWQFDRPAWLAQDGDQWFDYADWQELLPMLVGKKSVFITTGRLDQQTLKLLSTKLDGQLIIRTAVKPTESVADNIKWLQAIGPFDINDEIALMTHYKVDALVSKNSGGTATVAKLHAARQLQVPVYLLKRPHSQCAELTRFEQTTFSNLDHCENAVLKHLKNLDNT